MLPAVLPTCMFFTLYAMAGLGFALSVLEELNLRTVHWRQVVASMLVAAVWPVFVVFLAVIFVGPRGER